MENRSLLKLALMVYDFCGLNYVVNLSSLELKMNRRLKELNLVSIQHYNMYLVQNDAEWEYLIEILTVNETYFNREDKQLELYRNSILPKLRESSHEIKVWSCGCSTGDEPYTLAILTKQVYMDYSNRVSIYATDINKKVIQIAMKGVYNKKSLSFRRIPEEWLNTYFHAGETDYTINEDVKALVYFSYQNLVDKQQQQPIEKYDVIFCRNVLIYFDENTIKKTAQYFYNALKPGGYLFLGHAETITKFDLGFETINSNGTFYYRKE